jgi:hypothetical protein
MTRVRKLAVTAAVIGLVLVVSRVGLPYFLTWRINAELRDLPNYTGHVDDVDLALWRGAYALKGLEIRQRESTLAEPFLFLQRLEITVHWKALWEGEVVGEIDTYEMQLAFVQGEGKHDTQLGTGLDWRAQLERLYPFHFNRIAAHDAIISFRAPGIDTGDRIEVVGVGLEVLNLGNVADRKDDAFATFRAQGRVMQTGRVELSGRVDPEGKEPTFELNLELRDVPLPDVNEWLRQYAHVDATSGEFGMYAEVAAQEGAFEGYVKPIIVDAQILDLEKDDDNPLQLAWEALVAVVAELFENQPADQLATRIPLRGEFGDPEADVITAIFNVLQNAFVTAFSHSIDHSISLPQGKAGETEKDEGED